MRLALPDPVVRAIAAPLVDSLAASWRFRVRHAEQWRALHAARTPFIFLVWHEALLPLLWLHRRQDVAILVSEGKEGRYLAQYASRIGYRLIPGSSTRGGARALLAAVRALGEGIPVAITPDGPLGPRREVKPGIVRAAQRAGVPILPLHAQASSAWRLQSWDRLMIPRPGAVVEVAYGRAFRVDPCKEGLAAGMDHCADGLERLEQEMLGHGATR